MDCHQRRAARRVDGDRRALQPQSIADPARCRGASERLPVTFGLIGVALFFSAWFAAFGPLAKVRRGDPLYDLRVGLTAALVGLLVAGAFIDVSGTKFFWLILMLAAQFRTVLVSRPQFVMPADVAYEPPPGPRRNRTPLVTPTPS